MVYDKSGKILGVQIVGPFATELINQASIILSAGVPVEELSKTIFVHPTYSEIFGEILRVVSGKGIHYAKVK